MPITSRFSHFYLDGEAAFANGAPFDCPYLASDEAAEEWRAGWLAASQATYFREQVIFRPMSGVSFQGA